MREKFILSITSRLDSINAENINRKRFILKCISHVLLYCGKQGIALRGEKESVLETGNADDFHNYIDDILDSDDVSFRLANLTKNNCPFCKTHFQHLNC